MTCSNERRDKPLVKLVHGLQVHAVGQPHVFIHQVKCCVSNELVQVSVVILYKAENNRIRHISLEHVIAV